MKPSTLRILIGVTLAAVAFGAAAYYATTQKGPAASVVSSPTPAPRQFLEGTPAGLLETYLQGDAQGERLERANWPKYREMVLWPREPLWDSAYIIRDYRIHSGEVAMPSAGAEVTFRTLGELNLETFVYTPSPTTQTVPYKLIAEQSRWKIAHPMLRPHVSPGGAVGFLERMAVGHPDKKDAIERSIQAIRQAGS